MIFLEMLSNIRTPVLDHIFQLCTYLGQDIPVLVIICILFWCTNKKLGYQIGLTFFTSGLILQNLKITFRVERPWILNPDFKPVESAVPAATGYSFPSGHTQTATVLYSSLAFHAKKIFFKAVFVFLFLLVGFSRMYLGVHTPKDVFTAILLAFVSSYLIQLLMKHLKNTQKENLVISVLLGIASILTLCYTFSLVASGTISAANAKDCCSAGGAGLAFAIAWYFERTYINFSTDGSLKEKVIRFLIGIVITGLFYAVLKKLLPADLIFAVIRYFIVVLWIACIYPYFIKRMQNSFPL